MHAWHWYHSRLDCCRKQAGYASAALSLVVAEGSRALVAQKSLVPSCSASGTSLNCFNSSRDAKYSSGWELSCSQRCNSQAPAHGEDEELLVLHPPTQGAPLAWPDPAGGFPPHGGSGTVSWCSSASCPTSGPPDCLPTADPGTRQMGTKPLRVSSAYGVILAPLTAFPWPCLPQALGTISKADCRWGGQHTKLWQWLRAQRRADPISGCHRGVSLC